jgi:hypothetical protein
VGPGELVVVGGRRDLTEPGQGSAVPESRWQPEGVDAGAQVEAHDVWHPTLFQQAVPDARAESRSLETPMPAHLVSGAGVAVDVEAVAEREPDKVAQRAT